ncbi:hypothetical protein ACHAWF_007047 [Thalassiosira exigua]
MANNFLQNMGMQMPMFAAANQQGGGGGDDVDLHDIFADYFNEENVNEQQLLLNNALQQQVQQQQQQQQQVSIPTGHGIKTAWHAGSLPAMGTSVVGSNGMSEPAAKRSRGEELYLPAGDSMGNAAAQTSVAGQAMGGMAGGGAAQQQQFALAQAAAGAGALSNRLGFTLPNNVNAGMGGGNASSNMMGQQHQGGGGFPMQQQQQTPSSMQSAGGINLPIGMGMKFGAGGNITPQASGLGLTNGGYNTGAAINTANGGGSMATNVNHAMRVAVSNMQYGSLNAGGSTAAALSLMDKSAVEDHMAVERRMRNREHAKRSRVRKKFMLESLQQQVRGLQDENSTLRMLVQKHMPQGALKIIDECCTKSVLFATGENLKETGGGGKAAEKRGEAGKEGATQPLLRSDFSLIESLTSGQQNFVLSDPRLPDNPIVFASPGFYELTGYTREQVLGRNCRFLQGAGTDRRAVDVIRTAVANGTDATVCMLNYRADGTPFWNQLFVAALRDGDNCIVNYVGVQTMIEPNAGASALEDKVNAAHPMTIGVDDEDDAKEEKDNAKE